MSKKRLIYMGLVAMLTLTGCSSKDSILVPGQLESDCDAGAAGLGVCGTPKNIYTHRDQIKHIKFEEDESYRVDSKGKIWNTESGDEVKPSSELSTGCVGCEGGESDENLEVGASGKKNAIRLKNRSLVVKTKQDSAVIRDLGYVQSVWIAPHETRKGDLVSAHEIYVVIKQPKWIIGEEQPQKVERGATIPSPLVEEIFSDRHEAMDKKSSSKVYDYVNQVQPEGLEKIEEFINAGKKEK